MADARFKSPASSAEEPLRIQRKIMGLSGGGMMDWAAAMKELSNQTLRPIYLLYGQEQFLQRQLLAELRRRLITPDTAPFNYHRFEPGPEQASQAVAIAQTVPFWGEARLVVMFDCPLFAPAKNRTEGEGTQTGPETTTRQTEILLGYLAKPAPHSVLVITAGDAVDSRRKLTRAVTAHGAAVDCRPLWPNAAAAWCIQHALALGKRLEPGAADLLVDKVGTDLGLLTSELEKLALYTEAGPKIEAADVARVASGQRELPVWDLIDAVAEERPEIALDHLDRMLREGTAPPLLIWHLGRHYNLLLLAKALEREGMSAEVAASRAKQSPRYWQKLMGQARRFDRSKLVKALEQVLAADVAFKSGYDDRLMLEALVIRLAAG